MSEMVVIITTDHSLSLTIAKQHINSNNRVNFFPAPTWLQIQCDSFITIYCFHLAPLNLYLVRLL